MRDEAAGGGYGKWDFERKRHAGEIDDPSKVCPVIENPKIDV